MTIKNEGLSPLAYEYLFGTEPVPQPSAAVAIADAQARQLLVSGQHKAAEYVHPFLSGDNDG